MTTVLPMQCFACSRLVPSADPDTGSRLAAVCDAFPGAIPKVMVAGGDHRLPLPGDNGLRFAQADSGAARAAFDAWQRFTPAGT